MTCGDWIRNGHCVAEIVELCHHTMRLQTILLERKATHDEYGKWDKRIGLPTTNDITLQPANSPLWKKLSDKQRQVVARNIDDLTADRCDVAKPKPRDHQTVPQAQEN